MKETGIAFSVKNSEVLVRLKRHNACLGCRACSQEPGSNMVIKAVSTGKVEIGDKVIVEIDSVSLLKASLIVYLLPTAAFLAGIFSGLKIAHLLGFYEHKEILSLFVGIILVCISLFFARKYGIKRKDTYRAQITDVIKD